MDQDGAFVEVDGVPGEIAKLAGSQAMPVADQDGGGIPVTVSRMLACCPDEPFDLLRFQVFPRAIRLVFETPRGDFPVYVGWRVLAKNGKWQEPPAPYS